MSNSATSTATITVPSSVAGRLMTWLGSPAAAELEREAADKALLQRKADVAEWKRLDAALMVEAKAYAPLEAKLKAKHVAALAAVRDAETACIEARSAHRAKLSQLERVRDRIKNTLAFDAPGAITAFVRSLGEEIDTTANMRDSLPHEYDRPGWNNHASVSARIDAIFASRAVAEVMLYEAFTEAELTAKLNAIRASWPTVEVRSAAVA